GLGEAVKLGAAEATVTTPGYLSIPAFINGAEQKIILQWATPVINGTEKAGTILFPVAFPTTCLIALPIDAISGGNIGTANLAWDIKTTTKTELGWAASLPADSIGSFVYLAIGY
ncbi:gp53-like domain-containing protein, partial [Mixta tenebrionis]|uniref:gp53-like domain-containing protein n=1 Tax=Mixta tenebrionis TaxID=2562439 RepID=UPI003CCC7C0E